MREGEYGSISLGSHPQVCQDGVEFLQEFVDYLHGGLVWGGR